MTTEELNDLEIQGTGDDVGKLVREIRRLNDLILLHEWGAKTARDMNGDLKSRIVSLEHVADRLAKLWHERPFSPEVEAALADYAELKGD